MACKENRLIDIAVDIVVYESATHGEHAGKLSVLLTTRHCDVYGCGMNTLITNAVFNRDYPMQESNSMSFSSWVKVDKLCELNIKKIAIGFGCGAAVTRNLELMMWGTGATTYLPEAGVEIVGLFDPSAECRFCNVQCADYGRRIGNIWLSYCKEKQTLVTYSSASPPPDNVLVRRLGNRRYGALTCSACMKECDIQVVENHSFNFCNNCTILWDLDENARPMNVTSAPMESFLRRLEYPGRIRDVTPSQWGFWVLTDSSRLVFSGFFIPPDAPDLPKWWKNALSIPYLKPPHKIISAHSSKSDVFVITDSGVLFKRVENENFGSDDETHILKPFPLDTGVKKMCCGRHASLCLLDDGAVWIIYSNQTAEDIQTNNAEKIYSSKGVNECLDISGISYADLFYVHTNEYQGRWRKKHPLIGNLIEVIMGELDCKTFLWHFSDRCRVWNEGKISYDPLAAAQLISQQLSLLRAREEVAHMEYGTEVPSSEVESPVMVSNGTEPLKRVTGAGIGMRIGASKWSSWGSRLLQTVAVGCRCLAEVSKMTYHTILEKMKLKTPKLLEPPSIPRAPPPVSLPPFQSSLYGKLQFADLMLHLYDGDFPAHRVILCSRSKFWLEKLAESSSDVKYLDMKVHNPRAYRCLLKHYYQIEPDDLIIKDLLDLLVLATSYSEYHIAGEVEEKIKSKIDVDNVTKVMEMAAKNGLNGLQDYCELFMRTDPAFLELPGVPAPPVPTTSPFSNPFQPEKSTKQ